MILHPGVRIYEKRFSVIVVSTRVLGYIQGPGLGHNPVLEKP